MSPVRASLLFALTASCALYACAPRLDLGAACDLNSECPSPLVCRNDRCRTECTSERDCPAGLRCVQSNEGGGCTLPAEEACTADSCPTGLVCAYEECRSECDALRPCTARGVCVEGTCEEPRSGADAGVPPADAPDAPDAACTPGPLTCGNGVLDLCDSNLQPLAAVLAGSADGELEPIDSTTLPIDAWPFETDARMPLRPEIGLGLTRAGFGVVSAIGGGADRDLLLYRFDLAGALRPVSVTTPSAISNAGTVAMGEVGDAVNGFVLRLPAVAGENSGFELTFAATGMAGVRTINPSNPPNTTRSRLALVGGERSIGGAAAPIFYVARETLVDGTPVIGAIDDELALSTYRSSLTDAVDRVADDHVASSGSAGSAVLLYSSGNSVGIWDILDTSLLYTGEGPSGPEFRDRTDEVVRLTPSGGIAGVPALERRGPTAPAVEYVMAVPTDVGGFGYTRFYSVVCPLLAPCELREAATFGELQTRTGRPPLAVDLARLPGGWALVELDPEPEGGPSPSAYLRFLDEDFVEVEPNAVLDSFVPLDPVWQTMEVEVRAVTDGTTVTLIVAALQRDAGLLRDRIWLRGYRGCIAR